MVTRFWNGMMCFGGIWEGKQGEMNLGKQALGEGGGQGSRGDCLLASEVVSPRGSCFIVAGTPVGSRPSEGVAGPHGFSGSVFRGAFLVVASSRLSGHEESAGATLLSGSLLESLGSAVHSVESQIASVHFSGATELLLGTEQRGGLARPSVAVILATSEGFVVLFVGCSHINSNLSTLVHTSVIRQQLFEVFLGSQVDVSETIAVLLLARSHADLRDVDTFKVDKFSEIFDGCCWREIPDKANLRSVGVDRSNPRFGFRRAIVVSIFRSRSSRRSCGAVLENARLLRGNRSTGEIEQRQ